MLQVNKIFREAFWIMIMVSAVYAECSVETKNEIAYKISHGHAWINHAEEFSEKKRIANLEMPATQKIDTPEEFQHHIVAIMETRASKNIPGNRQVYWDDYTGTIVFYDPNSNDCGTAFRPNDGKEYYERVLKRKESDKERSKMQMHQNQKYQTSAYSAPQAKDSSRFRCDGRIHCSQMRSCEEATFFLNNCLNTKMDGNNDGVPCEKQWCK